MKTPHARERRVISMGKMYLTGHDESISIRVCVLFDRRYRERGVEDSDSVMTIGFMQTAQVTVDNPWCDSLWPSMPFIYLLSLDVPSSSFVIGHWGSDWNTAIGQFGQQCPITHWVYRTFCKVIGLCPMADGKVNHCLPSGWHFMELCLVVLSHW